MDINGAKALKERLGLNGEVEPQPARADVDIPEDAPPVYRWLGVNKPPRDASEADADDEPLAETASMFSRLGLSFR